MRKANRLLPKIQVDDSLFRELCSPWQEALVIKLLGKNLGYIMMKQKLELLWKLKGSFELMDVDHGFFMVKFDRAEDRENVIGEGPWMVLIITWQCPNGVQTLTLQ